MEQKFLTDLERGAEGLLVSSGQAAVAITLLGLLEGWGQHVLVLSSSIYEGTRGFLIDNLVEDGASRQSSCMTRTIPRAWERLNLSDHARALCGVDSESEKRHLRHCG